MIIVTIMLTVIFGTVLHFTSQNLEQDSLSMMRAVAMNPVRPFPPAFSSEEVRLPFFTLKIGRSGEVIASGGGYYDLSDKTFLLDLITQTESSDKPTGILQEYSLRFHKTTTPDARIFVFADISSELRTMENLLKSCLLIGGLSFLVFLVISIFLARWAVKPVEQAWEQQKQFVADASHELKTPLTVIMTNAELLQSPEYDAPKKAQFSDSILTMSTQMKHLVEGLLNLARADQGTQFGTSSSLDLSKLVSDALLPFEPVFFEQGLFPDSEIQPGIYTSGDPVLLRQAVEILLDNAQKYAEPGSQVSICLKKRRRNQCLLSVATHGEPISAADLKNIFKRFYRTDKARSRTGSYGLGLSIAETIVENHRGKIWAESSGGVNTFYIRLSATCSNG